MTSISEIADEIESIIKSKESIKHKKPDHYFVVCMGPSKEDAQTEVYITKETLEIALATQFNNKRDQLQKRLNSLSLPKQELIRK